MPADRAIYGRQIHLHCFQVRSRLHNPVCQGTRNDTPSFTPYYTGRELTRITPS